MTDNITQYARRHRERLRMHGGGTKGGVRDWEMTLFCVWRNLLKRSAVIRNYILPFIKRYAEQ